MTTARAARIELSARGRRALRTTAHGLRAGGAQLVATWRRSLQLRVGTTTVVVTGLVVLGVGLFLVDKVAGGLLNAKRAAAISQARTGLTTATSVLQSYDPSVAPEVTGGEAALQAALSTGGSSVGVFQVVLVGQSGADGETTDSAYVGEALRSTVQRGNLAVQYAPVPSSSGKPSVPGLIVGEPVGSRSGGFELYFLFPLTAEQQTIALVQGTVLLAGLALVLLVLVIALLVTRQVVRPVRVAAETAGLLAGGDLSKRIAVRGSDDIARLGQAFNDMADSLQRQIRRLEDVSRLQRRFTSDVSHELRTPLTTIRMAGEFLHAGRAEFSPELARASELLQAELDRFESLLGDLLEISRYDAGVARLESEPADIRSVVAASVAANQVLAQRHGSGVLVDVPDVPVLVDMDVRRVERVLRNLLGNALDHGEGKPIVIAVGYDDAAVAVTVRDHGIGLKPGEAGLVFNRFWRGDPSRSRLTGGTGLGLAISLEDARLHDGWLQAWGVRGRGAQFRLTLPRQAGHTLMHSPLPLDPDETDEGEDDE